MAPERRQQILFAGLGAILVTVIVRAWMNTAAVPLPSSNGTAAAATPGPRDHEAPGGRRATSAQTAAPDVHLKALDLDRPKPLEGARNLFQFKPKPPPPPPPAAQLVAPPAGPVRTGPPPPPAVPPIALKFIGIVQTADKAQRLAVLSDGRGGIPVYGKEGDIIEGRYRILRIGNESIEMAYLDGRGRQTIRLSGG